MRLRVRPMGLQDVENCVSLLASHPEERRRYGTSLEQLPAAWRKLIRNESLTSAVLEDMDGGSSQIVAFGAAAFISDYFLRRLKTAPLLWIGPELTRRVISGDSGVLAASGIREVNSNGGLSLVVWAATVSPPDCEARVHLELWRAFFQVQLGYHIKELICQPIDLGQVRGTIQAGLYRLSEDGQYADCGSQNCERLMENPFVIGGDRETATQAFGSWFSQLFSYTPPIIYFRPAEQRLILAALSGLTDDELSTELGLSLSAVKKTWLIVYDRAAAALPGEWPERPIEDTQTKRGKEKKQRLLAYLRGHMEELRPVLPPRSGRRDGGAPMHGSEFEQNRSVTVAAPTRIYSPREF
jgi:hypothetical protein